MNSFRHPPPFASESERKLWHELREHILSSVRAYSGNDDPGRIDRITGNWFQDRENYDGRWAVILQRFPDVGRVLDMAAGCGTFLLHGLHLGLDVWGVEPETWKREYFAKKIAISAYPAFYHERLITAWGEALPFPDSHFSLVTTYQTLEHVHDVRQCLGEMLRVLRPGGILYARAPDYSGFFEPHYGLPFLPKMNKTLAICWLKVLGRPLAALRKLNWITGRQVVAMIRGLPYATEIAFAPAGSPQGQSQLRILSAILRKARSLGRLFLEEKQIDLWVKKIQ